MVTETRVTDQDLTETARMTDQGLTEMVIETRVTDQDLTGTARVTDQGLTETETETRVADASAMAIETRAEEALTEMVATVSATVSICHLARMTRMTAQLRREHHSRETARTSMRRRCRVRI